jgi:hypothetical protein
MGYVVVGLLVAMRSLDTTSSVSLDSFGPCYRVSLVTEGRGASEVVLHCASTARNLPRVRWLYGRCGQDCVAMLSTHSLYTAAYYQERKYYFRQQESLQLLNI